MRLLKVLKEEEFNLITHFFILDFKENWVGGALTPHSTFNLNFKKKFKGRVVVTFPKIVINHIKVFSFFIQTLKSLFLGAKNRQSVDMLQKTYTYFVK